MATTKKDINIKVEVDEKNVPVSIKWDATDLEGAEVVNCRAMLLSMWNHKDEDTMRLDLWTKDMTINEMKIFFHQSLATMAATLENATNETEMAEDMRDFTAYFADKMDIVEK
ncbi:MAG TPA: gliding motility protein GldC [Balneolaceae bacterium]|nr:gliding motility protein GldC [Balneolaceae bacterium]